MNLVEVRHVCRSWHHLSVLNHAGFVDHKDRPLRHTLHADKLLIRHAKRFRCGVVVVAEQGQADVFFFFSSVFSCFISCFTGGAGSSFISALKFA